jgi:hypothetical protein
MFKHFAQQQKQRGDGAVCVTHACFRFCFALLKTRCATSCTLCATAQLVYSLLTLLISEMTLLRLRSGSAARRPPLQSCR